MVWKYFRSFCVCLKNDQSPCQLASENERAHNLASLKYISKDNYNNNERPQCTVTEQKSKSKLSESSSRNRPSKVSQFLLQTADSSTFKLPQMDGIPVGSPTDLDRTQQVPTSLSQSAPSSIPHRWLCGLSAGRTLWGLTTGVLNSTHKPVAQMFLQYLSCCS